MLVRPKALLFDFGGVLADTPDGRSDWLPTLVERGTEVVGGALSAVPIRVSRRMRSRLGHYTAASPGGAPAEIAIIPLSPGTATGVALGDSSPLPS